MKPILAVEGHWAGTAPAAEPCHHCHRHFNITGSCSYTKYHLCKNKKRLCSVGTERETHRGTWGSSCPWHLWSLPLPGDLICSDRKTARKEERAQGQAEGVTQTHLGSGAGAGSRFRRPCSGWRRCRAGSSPRCRCTAPPSPGCACPRGWHCAARWRCSAGQGTSPLPGTRKGG